MHPDTASVQRQAMRGALNPDAFQRTTHPRTLQYGLFRRQVPEIDGSSGGFIALVIFLSLIIIISCTAVFFLLRNRDPKPQEREQRRSRSLKYQRRRLSAGAFSYNPFSSDANTGSTSPSWKEKFGAVFSRGSGKHEQVLNTSSGVQPSQKQRGSGHGWVRAESGDDWEADEEAGLHLNRGSSADAGVGRERDWHAEDDITRIHHGQNESSSSVRLDLYAPGTEVRSYSDPFTEELGDMSSPQRELPFTASPPLSQPPHAPFPRVASQRAWAEHLNDAVREASPRKDSNASVSLRTFQGGTKFIESL